MSLRRDKSRGKTQTEQIVPEERLGKAGHVGKTKIFSFYRTFALKDLEGQSFASSFLKAKIGN